MKALTTTLLVGALTVSVSALAQYRWTAPDGSTAYGDRPQAGARDVQKLGGGLGTDEPDPLQGLPFEVRRAAQNFPVRLYTASSCEPCDAGRSALRMRGVPFEERTIDSRTDFEEFQRLGFGGGVPVLTVGQQSITRFEPQAWNKLLDAAGYPAASQLPRGWQPPAPRPLVEPPKPVPAPPASGTRAPAQDAPPPPPLREPASVGPARL